MRRLFLVIVLASACSATPAPSPTVPGTIDCGSFVATPLTRYDAGGTDCFWAAYTSGRPARWSVRSITTEGDPIPSTITFTPGQGLVVTRDTTADKFAGQGGARVWTYRCSMIARKPWATDATKFFFELTDCTGDGTTAGFPG